MILCFTGTRNSLLVARQLAGRLADTLRVIDPVNPETITTLPGERIVWVTPVHCWGLPKAVRKYLRRVDLPRAGEARHYLVATCGDDCGLTARMWRSELRRRGWKGIAAHSVFMPNTYVTLPGFDVDSVDVATRKLDAMPARVGEIARAIKCNSPIDSIHRGSMPWVKTRLLYPMFMRFLTSPHPFCSTDCISCGKCVKVCPLSNIELTPDGPRWADRCTLCLACYHVCPGHHIKYGRYTRRKGQYQTAFKATIR